MSKKEHWVEYFHNPNAVWRGFIVSIYLLGAFVGGLIAGPTSERIGRKRSIMGATVIFWFGTSMQTGASNVDVSHFFSIWWRIKKDKMAHTIIIYFVSS